MSERFEKSIQDWYNNSRIAGLEYLNLEFPKSNFKQTSDLFQFYCFHKNKIHHVSSSENPHLNFISDCVYLVNNNLSHNREQINLSSKVNIKHLYKIHETLENHEKHLEIIKKNQKPKTHPKPPNPDPKRDTKPQTTHKIPSI